MTLTSQFAKAFAAATQPPPSGGGGGGGGGGVSTTPAEVTYTPPTI